MENQSRASYLSISRSQKSSGSLPRNADSWMNLGKDMEGSRLGVQSIRPKGQGPSEKDSVKFYHLHSLDRQQSCPEKADRSYRKARSSSFHDACEEDRNWQDLMTDPDVALKLLKHQNKRQMCRFEEILRSRLDDGAKKSSSIRSESRGNLSAVESGHLGCKLETLKSVIDAQQSVIESLKQSSNPDSSILQDLLREQLFIDQELKFEKEAHENIPHSGAHLKSQSEREDFLTKEIDALKDSFHRSHKNAEQNQAKVLLQYLEQIFNILTDLDGWLSRQEGECSRQHPLGGDLQTLKYQRKELQIIQVDLEEKRILLEKAVETAHLAAHEDNLRSLREFGPNAHESGKLVSLIASINDLSHALPRRWIDIRQKVVDFYIAVCSTYKSVQLLQRLLDELDKGLHQLMEKNFWLPAEKLGSDNLFSEMKRAKVYHQSISTLKFLIEDCNAMANQLQDGGLILSHKYVVRLEEYNRKWKEMNSSAEQRIRTLSDILKTKDNNIQIFLSIPIQPPWERALTAHNVPYYINHETETTQWDHPEMTNLIHDLNSLNNVRFSAYRTAMKLRMLQLRLRLSSVTLDRVADFFKNLLCQPSDAVISAGDAMAWLFDLFVNEQNKSMPTVDLILNWLFNVFDSSRSGYFKMISFKVSIILLCNGTLEEKFKRLFRLVADNQGSVRQSQLASLLVECLKIPLQLGEVQAFGGLNVEPSVRNCFEKVLCDQEIKCAQFLEWTKMEPQSLVWLHVFHRLVAAERSVHQARCFVCKISPITGFRYHCLKCFNFDLCQNCFFSGCSARNHKLSHPMQEYFTEASSTEEMRDLKKMLKNKFRSKSYFKKHPRLGYLPVESTDEFFERSQSTSPKHLNMTPHEIMEDFKQKHARFDRMSNPSIHENSDEHNLIAQYCQNLHGIDEMNGGKMSQTCQKNFIRNDSSEQERVMQSEYNQIKLVRSEPSLLCRELSVDTGKEIFSEEDYLKNHKSRLEARIQYLEGQNRRLETTLDHLKNAEYEDEFGLKVLTYSSSPAPRDDFLCLGSGMMQPPPPLFIPASEKYKLI